MWGGGRDFFQIERGRAPYFLEGKSILQWKWKSKLDVGWQQTLCAGLSASSAFSALHSVRIEGNTGNILLLQSIFENSRVHRLQYSRVGFIDNRIFQNCNRYNQLRRSSK